MENFNKNVENIVESPLQKIDTLTALLAEDLDKKVYLTYGDYTRNYSLSLANWENLESIVSGNEGDEATTLLTDIYNSYLEKKHLSEEKLYDTAKWNKDTNSVTKETMEAASFTLKDFFKDMKNYISKE